MSDDINVDDETLDPSGRPDPADSGTDSEGVELDDTDIIEVDDTEIVEVDDTEAVELDDTEVVEVDDTEVVEVADTEAVESDDTGTVELEDEDVIEVDDTAVVEVDDDGSAAAVDFDGTDSIEVGDTDGIDVADTDVVDVADTEAVETDSATTEDPSGAASTASDGDDSPAGRTTSPATGEPEDHQRGVPRPYDFRRPNRLSRDQVRSLQVIQETFGRQWGTFLSSTLRAQTQISAAPLEQTTYDDYIQSLPNPTWLGLVEMMPLPGTSLLQIPAGLVLGIIELLTGSGNPNTAESRPLTEIESGLVRTLLDRGMTELAYAFESVQAISPTITGDEHNPQFAQAAAPSDMVIVLNYDMRVDDIEERISLCIPYDTIAPALEALSGHSMMSSRHQPSTRERTKVANIAKAVPFEVSVRLPAGSMTAVELADLAIGTVVPLEWFEGDELHLKAGTTEIATGQVGRHRNRVCFQVSRTVAVEP